MDQVTQQNAAMVEQTTAASVTLNGEADTLKTLVAKFAVSGNTGHPLHNVASTMRSAAAPAPVKRASPSARPAPRVSGANALAEANWTEF
ncbi:methyl-accepting protein IV [compost metagenome]